MSCIRAVAAGGPLLARTASSRPTPYLPELIGGRVDIAVMPVPGAAMALNGSRLAGVMLLARERLPAFPAIPTSAELDAGGVVFEAGLALYESGPVGTEVDGLHDALQRPQADDAVKKRFIELGVDPVRATREAAAQQLRARMRMVDEIRLEASGARGDRRTRLDQ